MSPTGAAGLRFARTRIPPVQPDPFLYSAHTLKKGRNLSAKKLVLQTNVDGVSVGRPVLS